MDIQLLLNDFSKELKNRSEHLTEDCIRYYLFACMLRQDPQLNNYMLELPYEDMFESSDISKKLPVYVDDPKINSEEEFQLDTKMELDMCYYNGIQCFSIEIKFHRHNNKENQFPHTMSAGALFNDIRRLRLIQPNPLVKEYTRLFLYVTDQQMHNYLLLSNDNLNSYRSKLKEFYSLEPKKKGHFIFDYDEKCTEGVKVPKTFIETANKSSNKKSDKNHNSVDVIVRKEYDSDFLCSSYSIKGSSCHVRLYSVQQEM